MPILPTRTTLLSSRIGDLRDWGLIPWCRCRSFPRYWAVTQLGDECGNATTLETILGRMRCANCRRPPSKVETKRGDPFAPRGIAIVLLETKRAAAQNRG